MSINLCSIDSAPVLSICTIDRQIQGVSRQTRKIVLDNLISKVELLRKKPSGTGTSQNSAVIQRIKEREKDYFNVDLNPELDEITVIVEFFDGLKGVARADNTSNLDVVMIDDFDDGSLNYSATVTRSETISAYQEPVLNATVEGAFIDDDLDDITINISDLED